MFRVQRRVSNSGILSLFTYKFRRRSASSPCARGRTAPEGSWCSTKRTLCASATARASYSSALCTVICSPNPVACTMLAATREPLAVNALGFAGMLLVKSARERAAVAAEGVGAILRGVGMECALEARADEHVVADEDVQE